MNILEDKYGITTENFNARYWHSGESLASIARNLTVDYETMRVALHKAGIPLKARAQSYHDVMRTGSCRRHNADYGFFDRPSPEMAWVLGVIASDGNIAGDLKNWGIAAKDEDLLDQVRELVQYTGPIRLRKDGRSSLVVNSKQMVQSLIRLGLTPAKSLTLRYPDIPEELNRHFIRGYFDGDGWFYSQKTQHSTGLYKGQVGITTGSADFAGCLMTILTQAGMEPHLKTREPGEVVFPSGIKSQRQETHILRMTGVSVARFFGYVYDGTNKDARLARKYDKFKQWYESFGTAYRGNRLNPTPSRALHFEGVTNE